MEALIAVGLAGNVVQFIQGAGQLISISAQIRKNGSPSSIPELQKLSRELTTQAAIVKSRLEGRNGTLVSEDKVSCFRLAVEVR